MNTDNEIPITPHRKKRHKRHPKKADHKHIWHDCVYGLSFAGNYELSIGTYCPICGRVGVPTCYTKWKENKSYNKKYIRSEWTKEALKEFNPNTRTLPFFEIELFNTRFVNL